jgi:hypothetical protein
LGPRHYATIRSTRSRKGAAASGDDDSLEMTKHSHDGGHYEIQVDISVQVEGGSNRMSTWTSPATNPDWSEKQESKKQSSTDTLVKDIGQVV